AAVPTAIGAVTAVFALVGRDGIASGFADVGVVRRAVANVGAAKTADFGATARCTSGADVAGPAARSAQVVVGCDLHVKLGAGGGLCGQSLVLARLYIIVRIRIDHGCAPVAKMGGLQEQMVQSPYRRYLETGADGLGNF